MKVLVVAAEAVDRDVIDELAVLDTSDEVRVMAPTLSGSALRYWMNDTDDALEHAQAVIGESTEQLAEIDADVSADAPTDDEPVVTIDDALRTFGPDRIVVIKHTPDDEAYLEDSLLDEIASHSDAPVDVREVVVD